MANLRMKAIVPSDVHRGMQVKMIISRRDHVIILTPANFPKWQRHQWLWLVGWGRLILVNNDQRRRPPPFYCLCPIGEPRDLLHVTRRFVGCGGEINEEHGEMDGWTGEWMIADSREHGNFSFVYVHDISFCKVARNREMLLPLFLFLFFFLCLLNWRWSVKERYSGDTL